MMTRKEMRTWFRLGPADKVDIVATRSALRQLPFIARSNDPDLVMTALRASFLTWASLRWPIANARLVKRQAADDIIAMVSRIDDTAARLDIEGDPLLLCASGIAAIARNVGEGDRRNDYHTFFDATRPLVRVFGDDIDYDQVLAADSINTFDIEATLWGSSHPPAAAQAKRAFETVLLGQDKNSAVWTEWYNNRWEGSKSAFGLEPNGDRFVSLTIAEQHPDFWNRSIAEISSDVANWINDARINSVRQIEYFRAEAARLSSPDIVIIDNRLDIAANPIVDEHAEIQAFQDALGILRGLLPSLATTLAMTQHRVVATCAEGYNRHLQSCGDTPILGLLDDWQSAMRSGYEKTDEREWDPGLASLLMRFFARHAELKRLFPRFQELERLASNVSLDMYGVNGPNVTGPFRAATEAIAELSEQGLASPALVEASQDQLELARDIAFPDASRSDHDRTLRLRRLLVRLVGFAEKIISLSANIATIADSPAARTSLTALRRVLGDIFKL